MILKIIGAILIISACSTVGFSIAAKHRKELRTLRELIRILDYMECELQYRLTPLPDLFRVVAADTKGELQQFFTKLSQKLDDHVSCSVYSCLQDVLTEEKLPHWTRVGLAYLGESLGRFDLDGQLKALESTRSKCRSDLANLNVNKDARLRSYQTLGICAGAAMVILFI